jgi:hypothetical protein
VIANEDEQRRFDGSQLRCRKPEILQQPDQVAGVLLDGQGPFRDIRRATVPLQIDRDDGVISSSSGCAAPEVPSGYFLSK